MMTAETASRRMTCRKNDGPPGSVCRGWESSRSPAFGNRLGQGLLTEHSIRSHTAPAGPPLWRTAGAVLFCGGQYRRLPGTALAAGRRPRKSYLRRGGDAGIAPSTGLARGCRRWGGTRFRGLCRAGVFARRLGLAASQGFRDDAGIVPCECRVWSCCTLKDTRAAKRQCTPQAALPPLPVCGPRIMRRTLKRACILRPLHLLRLAVSAAGGARLRSPLQGSLPKRQPPAKPPLQGEVDAPPGADGGVRRPALPISFWAAAFSRPPRPCAGQGLAVP